MDSASLFVLNGTKISTHPIQNFNIVTLINSEVMSSTQATGHRRLIRSLRRISDSKSILVGNIALLWPLFHTLNTELDSYVTLNTHVQKVCRRSDE